MPCFLVRIGKVLALNLTIISFPGDPGVGKTAIAEGLALRIVQGEVPESVCTRVFSLDLGAILATTACKSSYEIVSSFIRHRCLS